MNVAEVPVENNESFFGINAHDLKALRAVAEVKNLYDFMDPKHPRYVLISVDPAGGGHLSEEAFVVWLISSNRFALLSGRTVQGNRPGVGG